METALPGRFAHAGGTDLVEDLPSFHRGLDHPVEGQVHGVEIEDEIIGFVERAEPRGPGIDLDAAEVGQGWLRFLACSVEGWQGLRFRCGSAFMRGSRLFLRWRDEVRFG